jgi:hypothetical protein
MLPAQRQSSLLLSSHCGGHRSWLNHGHSLGQAARQQADVVADLVALQLLGTEVQGAVAVVHANLGVGQRQGTQRTTTQVVMLQLFGAISMALPLSPHQAKHSKWVRK